MIKLSHSSMSTYGQCPKKWEFKYVHRMKEKPRHYFSFGKAVHSALERMYDDEKCPRFDEVYDAFVAAWSDEGYKDIKAIGKAQAQGGEMLRAYYDSHSPRWRKPLAVEPEFNITIGHVPVRGFIDRVDMMPDGRLHVIDYKTGREIEADRIDEDEQLTMYQIAAEELFPDSRVGKLSLLHVPTLELHSSKRRSEVVVAEFKASVLRTAERITARDFPALPSEESCKWCDFKAACPAWIP